MEELVRTLEMQTIRAQIVDNVRAYYPQFDSSMTGMLSLRAVLITYQSSVPELYVVTAGRDGCFRVGVAFHDSVNHVTKYLIKTDGHATTFAALKHLLAVTERAIGSAGELKVG